MQDDQSNRAEAVSRSRQGRGRQTRAVLGVGLIAFLLGVAVTGYLAWQNRLAFDWWGDTASVAPVEEQPGEAATEAPESEPAPSESSGDEEARQAVAAVAVQQGGIDQRVTAMEQRLARLDLQAQAAAGNATRAEGLLIAFAARRAIERGAPLGYLADQLRLRFGDARPNAVRTVIEAARRPVTLDQLLARLEGLSPTLAKSPASAGALDWLGQELSDLFIVRRDTSPSPAPERRIARARLFLESGRTNAAVAEIRNLPNAVEAADWIEDAERYAAAQQALDLLETTAVLEPRGLRDAAGREVRQPSPASAASADEDSAADSQETAGEQP